jgi:sec-independent protein translocase protein TatA
MDVVFAIFSLGPSEMLVVGVVAVLLFGKRLPEVGRSFGKSVMEFKKSISGFQEEFRSLASTTTDTITSSSPSRATSDYEDATAPKFEPPSEDKEASKEETTEV